MLTVGLRAELGLATPALSETLLDGWSPGKVDLLDYGEVLCDLGAPTARGSGNPTPCRMDQSSAPASRR